MSITCPDCNTEIEEIHDTTYSNVETARCYVGQHTGDIYRCPKCDEMFINDFLDNEIYVWRY